ncbi:MAG: 2,3-bisphosphoglycerate-independent phosphoglycerate mutase [Methanomassiliicoccales archaeon]|nr:2,3-bisphosphoglycerate-independent phosphoglycerate mutase [Methanomassiliicoccales archaeon]
MSPRKILVVVFDGLGDRAVRELGWKTPLQASRKPNLDWYAAHGVSGLVDVISPGVRPGSDTSHLAILGYDPYQVYTGRGPFEAAGVGIVGKKGDVAFRCNFATVDSKLKVLDRRAGRIKEPDTGKLAKALNGLRILGTEIIVKEATEHRAVLLLRGEGLSAAVSDVDPHDEAPIRQAKALAKGAEKTAKVVNAFVLMSHDILAAHPVNATRRKEGKPMANILLPRGAGEFPDIAPFEARYGMKGACVAGVSLIRGIGRVCGLEVVDVKGATGGIDTDMNAKAKKAIQLLKDYDFVLVNVKATDIASHDGDAKKKVEIIEKLDSMVGILRKGLGSDVVVAFMADHCTPVEVKDHSGDPVPLMIYCEGTVHGCASHYDESSAMRGGLGRLRGKDIMPILLDKAGRSEKFGS